MLAAQLSGRKAEGRMGSPAQRNIVLSLRNSANMCNWLVAAADHDVFLLMLVRECMRLIATGKLLQVVP